MIRPASLSTAASFAVLAAGFLLPAGAPAGPVTISPVSIKLEAGSDYGSLRVGNPGSTPTGVEVEVLRVRLEDSRETYSPTDEFVVSPPSFMLLPGDSRLLRFRFNGRRTLTEGVYRVFVRQLPDVSAGSINFALNFGVPVFVAPTQAQPALTVDTTPAGQRLRNTGNVTVTVREISGCSQPLKLAKRLFPQQAVPLDVTDAGCLQTALSDRGPIGLDSVRR